MQIHLQDVNIKRADNGYDPLPHDVDMLVLLDQRESAVSGQSRPPTPSSDRMTEFSSDRRRFQVLPPVRSRHFSRNYTHRLGPRPRLKPHTFGWFVVARERVLNDVCGLCQEDYKDNERIVDLPCEHFYHEPCLEKWNDFQRLDGKVATCPLCKRSVSS